MNKPATIRITDLAEPEHSDFAKDVFSAVADMPVEFSVEAFCAAATEELGDIPVYIDAGMQQRLSLLCSAMDADLDLSAMGRVTNHSILLRYLVQRSRLEDLYARHPEIETIEIEPPLIIAGLPRTGTTHLLNLISADHRLRSLSYWESLEPIPVAAEQALPEGVEDPRIQRCRDSLGMQDQLMPLFKNMHEMTPEHIHEEIELMGMDYSMMLFESYAILPSWRDAYLAQDQTPHYEFLKRALKALQWLRGPQRWILKSPQHIEQLVPLQHVFPDATFVLTHRDPVAVIASMLTMQTYASRLSREPVRPHHIGDYWSDRIIRMLQACERDRDTLPEAQTLDLRFSDILSEDLEPLERIYALAGHPFTDEVRGAMQQYMLDHPRGRHGQIEYDLLDDFGIDPDQLRQQLGSYYSRFGL